MRDFLSEYISTLSTRRRERVHDLLRAAKTDKSNLDNIANKLADFNMGTPIVIGSERFAGVIQNSRFSGVNADVLSRFVELYGVSNDISLMLDTYTSVLTSEIKALEDEIMAMTKAVDSYAFTLADNGAYDFSFIETFSDDTMRSTLRPSSFTDRSGINFGDNEGCYINTASGTLTLAPALEQTYSLTGAVTNSNCGGFVTSDTGLSNALSAFPGNGWRVAVSSPRPISSTITTLLRQGAQFEIEVSVNTPSPSDSIVVTPFSERPFEILKMEVFSSEEGTEETRLVLIDGISVIDKPTDYSFPLRTVTKVRILINQPIYKRGKLIPYQPEETYRTLHNAVLHKNNSDENQPVRLFGVFRRNQKALNRTVLNVLNKSLSQRETRILRARIPTIDFDPDRGPMSAYDFTRNERKTYAQDDLWKATSQVNVIFRRMIHEKIFASSPELLGGNAVYGPMSHFFTGGNQLNRYVQQPAHATNSDVKVDANVTGDELANVQNSQSHFLNYEYDLGFRSIQIGRGMRVFRGIYVSKALPANSDSGEVKIKVDDVDYLAFNSDRDSKRVTSVEYSVTNQSEPESEVDWIPIMPTNKGSFVEGERLFFNDGGSATFRFPVDRQGEIHFYKAGYSVDFNSHTMVYSADGQSIIGIRIPIGILSPHDIYTVDYNVYGDQSIVNFKEKGFERSSLATAYDEYGAGQTFFGTYNSRSISLANEVYVDHAQIDLKGSYSSTLGFQGSYQPVTIVMADGSVALNQTNYQRLSQNSLTDFDESVTAFIHSGRNITFNRPIHERFTVYYQYLPSNLKMRAILRVNDLNYVSPQVNSIQIKTKTRQSNPKREV